MPFDKADQRVPKSLAQILFEASPSVGWSGSWETLDSLQIKWWINYSELARQYILNESAESASIEESQSRR